MAVFVHQADRARGSAITGHRGLHRHEVNASGGFQRKGDCRSHEQGDGRGGAQRPRADLQPRAARRQDGGQRGHQGNGDQDPGGQGSSAEHHRVGDDRAARSHILHVEHHLDHRCRQKGRRRLFIRVHRGVGPSAFDVGIEERAGQYTGKLGQGLRHGLVEDHGLCHGPVRQRARLGGGRRVRRLGVDAGRASADQDGCAGREGHCRRHRRRREIEPGGAGGGGADDRHGHKGPAGRHQRTG
mmetsp:Transcript_99281/g.303584  ORF Transcript_99281/g.303584 Transcript_99281/m.303584 type:complete len:242 (-) Transcript_99281:274-999(-)